MNLLLLCVTTEKVGKALSRLIFCIFLAAPHLVPPLQDCWVGGPCVELRVQDQEQVQLQGRPRLHAQDIQQNEQGSQYTPLINAFK